MNIIFFGTSQFAVPTLQKLAENFNISAVVTKAPRKAGRGMKDIIKSAIQLKSLELKLNILTPETLDTNFIQQIKALNPDVFIVVDYGKIIPQEILDLPKGGAINIHPSALPKYRGASPLQTTVLNGEKETAVTIMLMDDKMDHGPILAQKKVNMDDDETYESLYNKTSELSAPLLIKTLKKYLKGDIKPQEQNHDDATFTKIIKKENGKIDWNKSAKEIEQMIRAFTPWPGTFTFFPLPPLSKGGLGGVLKNSEMRVKILSTCHCEEVFRRGNPIVPGTFFKTKNGELAIMCKDAPLLIKKIQPEGKKPMSGEDFIKGYLREA